MHPEILDVTGLPSDRIAALIDGGTMSDVTSGALALAWARVRENARISLVSAGIRPTEARKLGFTPYLTVEQALAAAFERHGADATATVLTHAPDSLPLLPGQV